MTTDETGVEQALLHSVAALERTALAWERTAVSLAAVGLLLLKVADGGRVTQAAGLVLVAMAATVVLAVVPLGIGGPGPEWMPPPRSSPSSTQTGGGLGC